MIYVGYDTEIKQNFLFHDLHPPTCNITLYMDAQSFMQKPSVMSNSELFDVHAE